MTAPSSAGSAGDVEALAKLLDEAERGHAPGSNDTDAWQNRVAHAVLASDWLAAHTARALAADRERLADYALSIGPADALDEAADRIDRSLMLRSEIIPWLRRRAADLRALAAPHDDRGVMGVEESITRLWDICDDEWHMDAGVDQWWVVRVRCPHGTWTSASRGALDLETAFARVSDLAAAGHGHGWVHDCDARAREVWWPTGTACLFCGRRFDESTRS